MASTAVGATSSSAASSAQLSAAQSNEIQTILTTYKAMRAGITELANKLSELDSDRTEHSLVIRTISPLPPTRRAYRSINGVLVERTIGEVLPAVQNNLRGIEELIKTLSSQLAEREAEADAFRAKHNITMGQIKDAESEENDNADDDSKERKTSSSATRRKGEGGGGVLA